MNSILIIAELHENHIRKSTHSTINFARNVSALRAARSPSSSSAEVRRRRLAEVAGLRCGKRSSPSTTRRSARAMVMRAHRPDRRRASRNPGGFDVIAITASSVRQGPRRPRVAAKLGAGYAPDISGVTNDGGKLTFRRPVFAGNAYATCRLTTAHPGGQRSSKRVCRRRAERAERRRSKPRQAAPADAAAARVEFLGLEAAKSERPDLGEARVIVSGGRALKEKFAEVLDPLANLLNAAVGAPAAPRATPGTRRRSCRSDRPVASSRRSCTSRSASPARSSTSPA